jgi:hypothetical protein
VIRAILWIAVVVSAIGLLGIIFENDTPIRPEPGTSTSVPEIGRYANCEAATAAAGPGPHREGTLGYDPYLDRNMNAISCEDADR